MYDPYLEICEIVDRAFDEFDWWRKQNYVDDVVIIIAAHLEELKNSKDGLARAWKKIHQHQRLATKVIEFLN